MTYRGFKALAFMLLGVTSYAVFPAHADIGAVGNPIVPSNAPDKGTGDKGGNDNTATPEDNQVDRTERHELLVIKFASNTTYFKPQLKNAIVTTEKMRRGAFYEVVSYVPSGMRSSGSSRSHSDKSEDHLNAVLRTMGDLGVPPSRVTYSTVPSDKVSDQEVHIFLKAPPGAGNKSDRVGKDKMKNQQSK